MFSVNQLSVQFNGNFLFDDVSFIINPKDRIGLVGKNGAGKTTLLRIMSGELLPEQGHMVLPAGSTVGYLPQEMELISGRTVFDEALQAFEKVLALQKEIEHLNRQISEIKDYESPSYLKLLDRLSHANEEFSLFGGNTMEADAGRVLSGLGFEQSDFIRPLTEFSGGWKMRVELAKLLLRRPDLLLLDEPTNHLDIESIQWLEEFLTNYNGALVLVSHDRAFLDNVTRRTIEISLGRITDYKAGYSEYVELMMERREQQFAAYSNQQKQIEQVERFITRFRAKSTKARQVKSKQKYLDKIERVEIDEVDTSAIHFRFPAAPHSGKVVVECKNLSKAYGEKMVLQNLDLAITRGEKVAFVGRNGEGKTTLSRIIVKELSCEGNMTLGHQVSIGYFAQNQAELLDMEKTVFQTIDDVAVGDMRPRVRGLLGSFLFSGEAIDKKVKVLSGGEKSRLAIAKLLLTPVNLLVLDEPTNHLDMVSKDILKSALLEFKGTLIVVSHDRDFLQGLTEKVFEFRNKGIRQYFGDVYDFLDARKLESLQELEVQKKHKAAAAPAPSPQKISYSQKKDSERELRKIQNRIKQCEEEISRLESELKRQDEILAAPHEHPGISIDQAFYWEYRKVQEDLEHKMLDWEELNVQLESLKGNG